MAIWQQCDACDGARVQGQHCLAHLTDGEWAEEAQHLRDGGRLDARGVAVDSELSRLLRNALGSESRIWLPASAARAEESSEEIDFQGARFLGDVDFHDAKFGERASFKGAQFCGDADFSGALFSEEVSFDGARFSRLADFVATQFSGPVDFSDAEFFRAAIFSDAQFSQTADFTSVQFLRKVMFQDAAFLGRAGFLTTEFSELASFRGAQFSGEADFVGATFANGASFQETIFSELADFTEAWIFIRAYFSRAQFRGIAAFGAVQFIGETGFDDTHFASEVRFAKAYFGGAAAFDGAVFRARITIGPIVGSGLLSFDGGDFEQGVQLDVSVPRLSCKGTRFGWSADLNVRWAEVVLDRASFVERSRLVGVSEFPELEDGPAQLCHLDRRLDAHPRPRLLSVRQANVERLALGNVDLSACCFFGAHGLDQIRMEADCRFAQPPPNWRYARRRTLAEEHRWRADRSKASRRNGPNDRDGELSTASESAWYPSQCRLASWVAPEAVTLDPARIASLYRALRKAFEDRKDEPGAADFYYGEMEMRRLASVDVSNPDRYHADDRATHTILTLYWALAGYGLRASRAFFAFASVIVLTAFVFAHWGFDEQVLYGRAALFALESSVSLLRAPEAKLSLVGQGVDVFTKLAGPLFFGLALFSLRGRVKR
jgi:uncharacterized protein YjbI with pentapeptide repeats